jgi:hypothetical protein
MSKAPIPVLLNDVPHFFLGRDRGTRSFDFARHQDGKTIKFRRREIRRMLVHEQIRVAPYDGEAPYSEYIICRSEKALVALSLKWGRSQSPQAAPRDQKEAA